MATTPKCGNAAVPVSKAMSNQAACPAAVKAAAARAAKAAGPGPPSKQLLGRLPALAAAAAALRKMGKLPPASVTGALPLGEALRSGRQSSQASQIDDNREYTGVVILYDAANGRGFIMSEEVKKLSGGPVCLDKSVFVASGAKLGDTVSFRVRINAKGVPEAQHPLRILDSGPPRGVVISKFPEEFLAMEAGEVSELLKSQLEPFGALVAAPKLTEDGKEAIATFGDAAAAKSAVDGLANAAFKVALRFRFDERKRKLDEDGEENSHLSRAIGACSQLDLTREYLGVIKQIDEETMRGFIESEEVMRIANCLVQVHKNVLLAARGVRVGDRVSFKIHLTTKGLPQAQRPLKLTERRQTSVFIAVSRFPKDWFGQTPDDLVRRVTSELECFGSLSVPPTVSYGCKEVVAAFSDPDAARNAVQCSEIADYRVAHCRAPARGGRRRGSMPQEEREEDVDGSNAILVQGFPRRWSQAHLSAFLRGAALTFKSQVSAAQVIGQAGSTCGFARIRFQETSLAHRAGKELAGLKVAGRPLSVTMEDPERPHCSGMEGTIILHVDELEMPMRPEMEPAPTDREVWVDPLPDEEGLVSWLAAFGDAEEVFRPPDPCTGQPAERGYVVFEKHDAARGCVEAGAGSWSESERIQSSQKCDPRASAYPDSLVASFVGPTGQGIQSIQEATGVERLQLRGTDNRPVASKRVHFYAEGPEVALKLLSAEIESRLAEIHVQAGKRLQQDGPKSAQPEATDCAGGNDREDQWGRGYKRNKRRRRERDEGDGNSGFWSQAPATSGDGGGGADCGGAGDSTGWWGSPSADRGGAGRGHTDWWGQPVVDHGFGGSGGNGWWGQPPAGGSASPSRVDTSDQPPPFRWGENRGTAVGCDRPAAGDVDSPPPGGPLPGHWPGGQTAPETDASFPAQRRRARSPRHPPLGATAESKSAAVPAPALAGPEAAADAFFEGLPRDMLAPMEAELAEAVCDFLLTWRSDHPDGSRTTLVDLGADVRVRECRMNALPRGVSLRMWFERRLRDHIDLSRDEMGQTVVSLAEGVEVGDVDA